MSIEIILPGGTTPIPVETWSGDLNKITPSSEIPTFPLSDADTLRSIGRAGLAKALIDAGLLSIKPTITETLSETTFLAKS